MKKGMGFLRGLGLALVVVVGVGAWLALPWFVLLALAVLFAAWMLVTRRGRQASSVTQVGLSTLPQRERRRPWSLRLAAEVNAWGRSPKKQEGRCRLASYLGLANLAYSAVAPRFAPSPAPARGPLAAWTAQPLCIPRLSACGPTVTA